MNASYWLGVMALWFFVMAFAVKLWTDFSFTRRGRLVKGWWRLRFGFCPWCNSSPPDDHCPVCEGEIMYGPRLDPLTRLVWRGRYRAIV